MHLFSFFVTKNDIYVFFVDQATEPQVWLVDPTPSALYTLIKTGPDVPSRANPQLREYIHHLVINIPSVATRMFKKDKTWLLSGRGETILPYVGAHHRVTGAGLSRHVWLIFRHWAPLDPDKVRKFFGGTDFEHRAQKRAKAFAQENRLGNPVSIVCYQSTVRSVAKQPRNSTMTLLAALDTTPVRKRRDSLSKKSKKNDDVSDNKVLGECSEAEKEALRTREMLRIMEVAVAKGEMTSEQFEKIKAKAIQTIKRKKVSEQSRT